jgi:peptidoglycan/LPS O-acetylase OafA/YrhL
MFGSWIMLVNRDDAWKKRIKIPFGKYIATRSYAIYLLHPESYSILKRLNFELNFILFLVMALAITLIISEVLYRCLEEPFMELREKIPSVRSKKY